MFKWIIALSIVEVVLFVVFYKRVTAFVYRTLTKVFRVLGDWFSTVANKCHYLSAKFNKPEPK